MQLTEIFIGRSIPPIGGGGSLPIKRITLGQKCSDTFGGGVVASITLERGGVVVVRKDKPFVDKGAGVVQAKQFDCIVLLPGGEYAYGIDEKRAEQPKPTASPTTVSEKQDDPPPAKPIPAQPKVK